MFLTIGVYSIIRSDCNLLKLKERKKINLKNVASDSILRSTRKAAAAVLMEEHSKKSGLKQEACSP